MITTTVGAILQAAHRDSSGRVHGHTWRIWATFAAEADALGLQLELKALLADLDHTLLPDRLASGEAIAAFVGHGLVGCIRARAERPLEMIEAEWSI